MRGFVVLVGLAGCVETGTIRCGEVTCPDDTHCGPMNECVPDTCGDGVFVADREICDGEGSIPNGTLSCSDFGFYRQSAPLTCSATCEVDTSSCSESCGDHIINGPERCDGLPPTGAACADYGFDVGKLGCTDACEPAFDRCTDIGWRTLPGGATDELRAVFLLSPTSGVAVGARGQVLAASDGVWIPVTSPTTHDLHGVFGNPDGGIVAVGDNGTILRYDGTSVSAMASPTTAHLYGISGGLTGAFAVGANGTILSYDNTTWTPMTSPVTTDLHAVHALAPNVAYAVGDGGVVLRWNGSAWTELTNLASLPTPNLRAVRAFPGVVYVAGERGPGSLIPLARITNDAVVEVPAALPVGINLGTLHALWGESPNSLLVAGAAGTVMLWNGSSLRAHGTPTDRSVLALDGIGTTVVGVTRGGTVIATNGSSRRVDVVSPSNANYAIYTDETTTVTAGHRQALRLVGNVWTPLPCADCALRDVFAAGDAIYATAVKEDPTDATPGLYRSIDAGAFARLDGLTLAAGEDVHAVWGRSATSVVAVGSRIWESSNASAPTPADVVFTVRIPQPPRASQPTLRDVWAAADGTWFAVGDDGYALQRTPGANGIWTEIPTNLPYRLTAVWGTSADDVFAVGALGVILHWDGSQWRRMYAGVAEDFVAISGSSPSDVFVTGTGRLRMHYDGVSWSRMASPVTDLDMSTSRGTTYHVYAGTIERLDRAVTATELDCRDAWDNDLDGETNCDDSDCFNDPLCRRGGACETLERVTCATTDLATSTFSGVARIDDLPCLDHSTPGPEASYRFVAEASGPVTVTIADVTNTLELVVTDAQLRPVDQAQGACVLDSCRPATDGDGIQTVTFSATAGQLYYIVVDGPAGAAASFTLSVGCG